MTRPIDCVYFDEQLDALMRGKLPDDAKGQLVAHAAECTECSMTLRIQKHLLDEPLEALEARVPKEHLDAMWDRVEGALEPVGPSPSVASPNRSRDGRGGSVRGWWIPTLAAACLVLLVSTTLLGMALAGSRSREARIANQMTEFEQRLAGGGVVESWIRRTSELGQNPSRRIRAAAHYLQGADEVSLQSLSELLARFPEQTILLDADALDALTRAPRSPGPEYRDLLAVLNNALDEIQPNGGLRVGDFAEWLSTATLPQDLSVPTTALLELLS